MCRHYLMYILNKNTRQTKKIKVRKNREMRGKLKNPISMLVYKTSSDLFALLVPSAGPTVCPTVCPTVRLTDLPSVRPSVGQPVTNRDLVSRRSDITFTAVPYWFSLMGKEVGYIKRIRYRGVYINLCIK